LSKTRELIISPKVSQAQLTKFLPQLEDEGIKMVYLDPKKLGKKKTQIKKSIQKVRKLEENFKFYQTQILKMFST